MGSFVLLDEGTPHECDVEIEDANVWLDPADLDRALGWELKPEGLCRGQVCIPARPGLVANGWLDLEALAEHLGRPLAVHTEAGAAYMGPPISEFNSSTGSLVAPEFSLPDLNGNHRSLSDYRGSKVLLAAWASW